jgi:4-amino-4-deoxy-L-arabinose transferase-like glycosyltransferase
VVTTVKPERGNEHRRAVRAVAAVCFVGLLFRLPLVVGHLPRVPNPDEPNNVAVAEKMVEERSTNPRFFNYPALLFEVTAAGMAVGDVFGGHGPVLDVQSQGDARANRPLLVGSLRALSALCAIAAAAGSAALAWAMRRRWLTAAGAAALVCFSPIDLRATSLITPEGLTAATTTAALVASVRLLRRPTPSSYALAGAAVGLAASAKYNAVLVAVSVVVGHAFAGGNVWRRMHLLGLAVAAAILMFLVANPHAVLDRAAFLEGIRFERHHYSTGHPGSEGHTLHTNLRWLASGFGPVLIGAVVPVVFRHPRRREAIVIASFVVAYFAFVSSYVTRFERNLVPVVAPMAALVAVGVALAWEAFAAPRGAPLSRVLGISVICAALTVPVIGSARAEADEARDPWTPAERWFADNIPEGSSVVVEKYSFWVDPARWNVTSVAWYPGANLAGADYLVVVSRKSQRFTGIVGARYRQLLDACVLYRGGDEDIRFTVTRAQC